MKKLLSLLLVMLVLVGCTTSTTNNNGDDETINLTFWSHQTKHGIIPTRILSKLSKQKNENIKIKYENFPYDDFESKVQTSLIEGSGGADIYEIWGGWAIDFAPTGGALEEIPSALAAQVLEDTYDPTTGSLLVDGKLYGLPLEFNIESGAMIINKKIMEAKGLEVPTTWEELIEVAKAGTEMDGQNFKVKGFDFVNWDSIPYTFISMILSQGGQYLTDTGVDFNTPEAKEAFAELTRLVTDEKVTDLEGLVGSGELEGYQALYADRVMMVPRGPWALSEGVEVFELEYGVDFDYVELPWYAEGEKFAAETGWSLAVNAQSKEKRSGYEIP